jgi:glycosyltransferase involved in cell wall biosynthesis
MISVYITTRNRATLLKRAILSVLNQTYQNIELIIIDDCSDNDHTSLIEELRKGTTIPITLLKNDVVRGACYSRNRAIGLAKGMYLTGLDDDDEFFPKRLETLLNNYKPSLSFVGANDLIRNANGSTFVSKRPVIVTERMILDSAENLVGNQVFSETYKWKHLGFDERFPALQDFEAYFRMIQFYGEAAILNEPLQIIYKNDTVVRVTTYYNQMMGIIRFYLKYKSVMNLVQRKRFILKYWLLKSLYVKRKVKALNVITVINNSNSYSIKRNLKFFTQIIKENPGRYGK